MKRSRRWIAQGLAMCLALTPSMPVAAEASLAGEGALTQSAQPGVENEMPDEIREQTAEEPAKIMLEEAFPDPVFRAYMAEHADTDGDGILSAEEAAAVTELSLAGMGITSLKGIRYLSGLQALDCSGDPIGALDLSDMEQLQTLICAGSQITLSVDGEGRVDLSEIPDMDVTRIREISQGTLTGDILQLPEEMDQDQFTYVYDTARKIPGQPGENWTLEVTVMLEKIPAEDPQKTDESQAAEEPEQPQASQDTMSKKIPSGSTEESPNEVVVGRRLAAGGVSVRADRATITSCQITGSKDKVQVKARIPKQVKSQDDYYYLFASSPVSTKLATKPLAKVKKGKTATFTVPLNYDKSSNVLQSRFQVAVKVNKKYQVISREKYISNPQILADSTLPFIKGDSKKGLQFAESLPDAISTGTNYCLFNLYITELMQPGGLKYKYKGTTYDFNRARFEALGGLFSQFQAAGMNLSVEFLLPWVDGQTDLILPAARSRGAHNYYAWNISSQKIRNKYEALFSCIAEWFNGQNGHGYINNYVIGNEVNAFDQWHYTGSTSLKTNADLYADTYQTVYMAVKSKCKNARVSICIDHSWNVDAPGRLHSSKSFLDRFATRMKKYGSPAFAIAYHAYPIPLTQADFWNNSAQQVKNSTSSPYITMKNIQYLTRYVRSKYGPKTRIMLTEQGFSSHGSNGEKRQAAAIAYAFYKAEFSSMIDCIIFRSQADAQAEIDSDNLHMGLWTVGMGKKKAAYNVYKYMDTPQCEKYTKTARQYLKISKWTQLVPDYKASHFKK